MTIVLAINQELDKIRKKKNEIRQMMSELSSEAFGLSKVIDYLESKRCNSSESGASMIKYDDSSLLPILDKVLVLDEEFEVRFIVGRPYKV